MRWDNTKRESTVMNTFCSTMFILLLAFVNRNKNLSMNKVTNRLVGSDIPKACYLAHRWILNMCSCPKTLQSQCKIWGYCSSTAFEGKLLSLRQGHRFCPERCREGCAVMVPEEKQLNTDTGQRKISSFRVTWFNRNIVFPFQKRQHLVSKAS